MPTRDTGRRKAVALLRIIKLIIDRYCIDTGQAMQEKNGVKAERKNGRTEEWKNGRMGGWENY